MNRKAAIVSISNELLTQALGFEWKYEIVNAQMLYGWADKPVLQLVITGDSLSDDFIVKEGEKIRDATIILHKQIIETEIKVLQ